MKHLIKNQIITGISALSIAAILPLVSSLPVFAQTASNPKSNLELANNKQNSTPAATPESTPAATPESTPAATPESTPEATPKSSPAATPESTPEATEHKTSPSALVSEAYQGNFRNQGVAGFDGLVLEFEAKKVTATDVIQAGVDSGKLTPEALKDSGYREAVETELRGLLQDS